MNTSNHFLKFGDCILLSTDAGFVQSQGFTKPGVFIQVGYAGSMIFQRNLRDFVFQICPRMNYDAFKEYNEFKKFYDKSVDKQQGKQADAPMTQSQAKANTQHVASDDLKMLQLTKKLNEEIELNKKIFKRRHGELVEYGNEIQLLHYDSKSFLEGSKTCAELDKSCNLLVLKSQGSKSVCFIIEPRYKYRNEGQKVTYGDVVTFRNIKNNMYMHISDREVIGVSVPTLDQILPPGCKFLNIVSRKIDKRSPPHLFAPSYEINCSQTRSKFTVRPYRWFEDEGAENIIKGGQIVRLQHSESSGYICSDDQDFTDDGLAEVFLWNFKGKSNDIESVSTQSLFELEIVTEIDESLGQNAQYSGNISSNTTATKGGMLFRLRHLNTGRLVVMQEFEVKGDMIKSTGLSEHLDVKIEYNEDGLRQKVHIDCKNPVQQYQLESNSIFRLVSTGVDIDNRIRQNTSVQIQHVESKSFLCQDQEHMFKVMPTAKETARKTDGEPSKDEDFGEISRSDFGRSAAGDRSFAGGGGGSSKFINEAEIGGQRRNQIMLDQEEAAKFAIAVQNEELRREELDENLMKKMSDDEINQGSREVLTFQKTPSFENAFFIDPENETNIKNILWTHASVNGLNQFLPEIASLQLEQSKERQKKIEDLLCEMIKFVDENQEFDNVSDNSHDLSASFSLEVNDIFTARARHLQLKQKIMREMRVIEQCVQILHLPFASGAYDFKKIMQEQAITQICKLTYILLKRIVYNYPLNELYASQWIGLFLQHVLETQSNNQIGADEFVTQLVDQNETILISQFTTEIIQSFISKCQRGSQSPRLMRLLTALCSCQGKPVMENQYDIIAMLLENSAAKERFIMPIQMAGRRRKFQELELCCDMRTKKWDKLIPMNQNVERKRQQLAEGLEEEPDFVLPHQDQDLIYTFDSFLNLLDLLAETCLGRNVKAQELVGTYYESKILMICTEENQLSFDVRSRTLKLLRTLSLDRDPFVPMTVPSETMVWNQLPKINMSPTDLVRSVLNNTYEYNIKVSRHHVPRAMKRLQLFCEEYLRQSGGVMYITQKSKNEMTFQCLKVIQFMVNHGFYSGMSQLKQISEPIILLLNGANDSYSEPGGRNQSVVGGMSSAALLGIARYLPNAGNDIIIKSKSLACDILVRISDLETDAKCSVFMAKLKQDIEVKPGQKRPEKDAQVQIYNLIAKSMAGRKSVGFPSQVLPEIVEEKPTSMFNKISSKIGEKLQNDQGAAFNNIINSNLLEAIAQSKGFESDNEEVYICVLFDLMLYKYPDLTKRVFALLVMYFTRTRTLIEGLTNIQLLESSRSIQTLNNIKRMHLKLKNYQTDTVFWMQKNNTVSKKAKNEVTDIFKAFTNYCIITEGDQSDNDQEEEELQQQKSKLNTSLHLTHRGNSTGNPNASARAKTENMPDDEQNAEQYLLFDFIEPLTKRENQRLLRNFGIAEIALFFIKQRVDRVTNYNKDYIALIKQCYLFLVVYVRRSFQNQLKVYDDLDVFMRDIDKYQVASLLVYEIFRDNKKFLTLNVDKFLRQIVNAAEEVTLSAPKKALYLKLLEVFCRYEDKLVRQNQTEIILQMTFDTSRSNVLYLFQAEGAKELGKHIAGCLLVKGLKPRNSRMTLDAILDEEILGQEDPSTLEREKSRSKDRDKDRSFMDGTQNQQEDKEGTQEMNVPIFNVIQLLKLLTLCCEGKSDIAEQKCKEEILSFQVANQIVDMCKQFWPLKAAIMEYISHAFLDSGDLGFLTKSAPSAAEVEEDEKKMQDGEEKSDIAVLMEIVENMNTDIESYLNDEIVDHELIYPNRKTGSMFELAEDYIFKFGLPFLRSTLKRKQYDIGSTELRFYVIAKNIAELFYKTDKKEYKLIAFDVLKYIHTSERHAKYLDSVKHPAKKLKGNQDRQSIHIMLFGDEEYVESEIEEGGDAGSINPEHTKSSRLSQKLLEIANQQHMQEKTEREFEDLVLWVNNIDQKIAAIMASTEGQRHGHKDANNITAFSNVSYNSVISAMLRLLDARVLSKDLQLAGIKLLRKIVEVENKEKVNPAADWDTEDWVAYKRIIKMKQDSLVDRGCVAFLCKHISEVEDEDIQEECLLVCITLCLGGNKKSQDTFYQYMINEDHDNKLLTVIKNILQRYFELSKKFLTEKNAKLEMILKMKLRDKTQKAPSDEEANGQFGEDIKLGGIPVAEEIEEEDSDDNLMSIEASQDGINVDEETKSDKNVEQKHVEDNKERVMFMSIRVLRFLQLLCEGHHSQLQNHLREQQNSYGDKCAKSFDFVAYVSYMLGMYVKNYVNCYSTILGNQIIEALVEFIQGPCRDNQKTLVNTKAIDCCRDMLQQGTNSRHDLEIRGFTGKRKDLLDEIKMNSVRLLLSIIEGPVDEAIYKRVSTSLGDFQIMMSRMQFVYNQFLEEKLSLPTDSSFQKVQWSLTVDSFEESVLEGFDIFSLLNQLAEVLPKKKTILKEFEKMPAYKFFKHNTGNIEVSIDNEIQRLYFQIQPVCSFLTHQTKDKFLRNVDRESGQHKILGLLAHIPSFVEEMEHIEKMSHEKIKITPEFLLYLRDVSTLLAVGIGAIILFNYDYMKVPVEDGSYDYAPTIEWEYQLIVDILGYFQGITALMLLLGFCLNKINLVVKAGWRLRISQNQIGMENEIREITQLRTGLFAELDIEKLSVSQARAILQIEGPDSPVFLDEQNNKRKFGSKAVHFEYFWISLTFLIANNEFLFYFIYLVFSMQGLFQSPVFYSFHLLDIINRFPALNNVIQAVTLNGDQLILTAMLGVILIYIYAAFAFLFLADNYFDIGIHQGLLNKAGDSICMSLMHCFWSTFNYGLRTGGGMGEFLPAQTRSDFNMQAYYIRFIFDVSFFLIVITILLNVIFGIIIDTFAQLREKAGNTQDDIKNICFICGLDRYTLDRDTLDGFDFHKDIDHVIWNYVYFIIHLKLKDKTDFNGTESNIYSKFEKDDMSWFPMHKSLRQIKEQKKKSDLSSETNQLASDEKKLFDKLDEAENKLTALEEILK